MRVMYLSNPRANISISIQILKEFDKSQHIKLIFENPHIKDIDNGYYSYILEHNKKFEYYFVKGVFKLVFNDYEYCLILSLN